jgi:hypothetical protein
MRSIQLEWCCSFSQEQEIEVVVSGVITEVVVQGTCAMSQRADQNIVRMLKVSETLIVPYHLHCLMKMHG